jgi:tetratricopeptide (TPR) repeat protein
MKNIFIDNKISTAENLAKDNRYKEALEMVESCLEEDPGNLRALKGHGIVCQKLSMNDEAINSFKRIIDIDENQHESRKLLCLSLLATNKFQELEEQLNILLEKNSGNHSLVAFVAQLSSSIGKTADALDLIDSAIQISPQSNYLEYYDIKALISGLPRPSRVSRRPTISVCCAPGMDSFIHDIIKGLNPYFDISPCISSTPQDHINAIMKSDIVWLEWGNQLTSYLSQQKNILQGKQVVIRIHSYEVFDNLVDSINFDSVTDIVFVSAFLRDLFLKRNLKLPAGIRIHVIHNGIDIRKFRYAPRGDSRINLAFLAFISYKKDPMVLMQAYAFLHKRHSEIKLHIAGKFQDYRYELGIPHFLKECGIIDSTKYYGHINNVHEWLMDKDYILCTSVFESQGVSLLESMSRGCRPLIYNFPGASQIYPSNYLWTTFDDLEERFLNSPDPKEVSDFVAKYYSKNRELASFYKLFHNHQEVVEEFDLNGNK